MREFEIGKNDAGQRLDRFISKALPLLPDALAQKYIRIKRIKVNGRGAKRDRRLLIGDVLQFYVNDEFFERPTWENAYLRITEPVLDIVYEDENILLVNKPQGLLCHPASGGDWRSDTLVSRIQAKAYQGREWRPGSENSFAPALCNRIDRNTGGIVIAAKNAQALRVINEKIRQREIDKFYLAAILGAMRPREGELRGNIFRDTAKNQAYLKDTADGTREAVLQYTTLEEARELSLLECRLITGRTHQIRAQLADAGHPILGDTKYGSKRENARFDENRQCLWSYRVAFNFRSPAGPLEYLGNKEFSVGAVPFAEKYFKFQNRH